MFMVYFINQSIADQSFDALINKSISGESISDHRIKHLVIINLLNICLCYVVLSNTSHIPKNNFNGITWEKIKVDVKHC